VGDVKKGSPETQEKGVQKYEGGRYKETLKGSPSKIESWEFDRRGPTCDLTDADYGERVLQGGTA